MSSRFIKPLLPISGFILAGTFAPAVFAQTGAPLAPSAADAREAANQEYLRQQERERALRQQQEAQPDVRLQAPARAESARYADGDKPCFVIERVLLSGAGADTFAWALPAVDREEAGAPDPIAGRCVGMSGINLAMRRVQNAILARGYVTTRVLAEAQNIKSGTLKLSVLPGRIRRIRFADGTDGRATGWNAIPTVPDVVVAGSTASPAYQPSQLTAPGAKTGVAVTTAASATGVASVNTPMGTSVSGPAAVGSVAAVAGQSAVVGGAAAETTARLGDAGQAGPLYAAVHDVSGALLPTLQKAEQTASVASADGVTAAGPIAAGSGGVIDGPTATAGDIALAARKSAGVAAGVDAVDGTRTTGAIAGGIGVDTGSITGFMGKAIATARKKAEVAAAVQGGGAPATIGPVVATGTDTKVSDSAPKGPTGTALPEAASAAPGTIAPKPGTSKPNTRGIEQVALASPTATAEVVRTNTVPPAVPNASLYQISPAPEAAYLVQTDPRFANYREWTSANYLLDKVKTDPGVTQKRLGDGFYEQQLVREQMMQLTGQRYSGDSTSDEAQYRALMDSAAVFANAWDLRPGVALTAAQMAALTSDIVWLVEQEVALADGSKQKVLVPQVYVRVKDGDLDGSGALLAGKDVYMNIAGDLTNSGTIAGRNVVSITADNVANLGARIQGDAVSVAARNDLNNIGGIISANSELVASAGRDINITSRVAAVDQAGGTQKLVGAVAGLYVTGSSGEGSLKVNAGRDINLAGGAIRNTAVAGITTLEASRNINLDAATPFNQASKARIGAELAASGAMTLRADTDINLTGGTANADSLELRAANDINNIGQRISAESSLLASAGRDISLRTTTSTVGNAVRSTTTVDSVAGFYVNGTGADTKLTVSAGRDVNLSAGVIANAGEGGTTTVSAARDLNLGTVGIASRSDYVIDANNYRKESTTSEVGSQISGAGSVLLKAGNNLSVRASEVDAAEDLRVIAGNNIDITTGMSTYSLDQASRTVKKKTFSKKVTTKRDTVDSTTSIASALTGGTVSMNAGNDLNITGSAVVGDDGVALTAGKDINIAAAVDTNREWNHVIVKKSGFLSGGGFGISFGTQTTTTDQNKDAVTQSGLARSMVGSIGGDLTLNAGNAIKVGGTDMSAGGDMTLAGKSVTIDPGKDQIDGRMETRTVQDALTLKVGGSVVNAIQSVQSVQQTVQATDNTRVRAMAAATAAMAAKNAVADIQQNGLSVSLSLTAGHSESVQTRTTSETLHTGSVLTAGQDVNIVAKGDGANSGINIIGSTISAGRNVTLAADDQVNLLAAQDLESQHSESKSISAEAGVAASYSTKGGMAIGFTASVSGSKGHEDGEGTTQVNSAVNAAQKLTVVSGGDTNIKGAVASANQVVANVGGDLNIESLQDTAKFDSKTQSASVSGTIGYGASVSGSFSQTKISSDYASVQEQSGIKAGDGGFQIKVGGNTDLKGGVISSTEAGIAANSLVTRTLTQSQIENHSTMDASSVGLSGSATVAGTGPAPKEGPGTVHATNVGKTGQTAGISGLAIASSDDSSITKSSISAGSVVISDDAAQRAATGVGAQESIAAIDRSAATGVETSGKLANNFNAAEVQTTLDVTAKFSADAAKAVGDYAKEKLDDAAKLRREALAASDPAERERKVREADELEQSWKESGSARVALHVAVGGLAGGLDGALGAGAVGVATPLIAEQIKQLDVPEGVKSALTLAAGAAVGAAAGGKVGAVAATNEVENNYLKHKEILAADKAMADCAKQGGDVKECQKQIVVEMQRLDEAREKELRQIALAAAEAYDAKERTCTDAACVTKNEAIFKSATSYLNSINSDPTLSREGYSRGFGLNLSIAADAGVNSAVSSAKSLYKSASDTVDYFANRNPLYYGADAATKISETANGVWNSATNAFTSLSSTSIPAYRLENALDGAMPRTAYGMGELSFNVTSGVVTSYFGGKLEDLLSAGMGAKAVPIGGNSGAGISDSKSARNGSA